MKAGNLSIVMVSIYQNIRWRISWGSNPWRHIGDSLKTDNIVAHCIAIRKTVVRNILLSPIILETDWTFKIVPWPTFTSKNKNPKTNLEKGR
jgi:hypothetical protein